MLMVPLPRADIIRGYMDGRRYVELPVPDRHFPLGEVYVNERALRTIEMKRIADHLDAHSWKHWKRFLEGVTRTSAYYLPGRDGQPIITKERLTYGKLSIMTDIDEGMTEMVLIVGNGVYYERGGLAWVYG